MIMEILTKGVEKLNRAELAKFIQFTKTSPSVTKNEMIHHFEQCAEYGFNAAMVPMYYVSLGKEILKGTDVKVATFFGFGMGHETLRAKEELMKECMRIGADEVDFQPNMSAFLSGDYVFFEKEARLMLEISQGIEIKPMLEIEMIPDLNSKIRAIKIYDNLGYMWVKNSSGAPMGGAPATPNVIRLIRENVRPECRVKASGKVNSYEKMVDLVNAGASMVGTSSGLEILLRETGLKADY